MLLIYSIIVLYVQRETTCAVLCRGYTVAAEKLHVRRDYGWQSEWSSDGCYVTTMKCSNGRRGCWRCLM